jgi:glutathione S-transferase
MSLFMVIEHYKDGPGPVYARAGEQGRMIPDGVRYVDSWVVAETLDACYQLMETDDASLLETWMDRWRDLVDFEVHPVITSAEAAAARAR